MIAIPDDRRKETEVTGCDTFCHKFMSYHEDAE